MTWLFLSLLAAFLSAARVILVKVSPTKLQPLELAYVQYAYATPLLFIGAFLIGIPSLEWEFWITVLFTGLLVSSGTFCFFTAIRLSDLSLMTPLRSITPALLLIIAPHTVDDRVSLLGAVGIVLIIIGVCTINYRKNQAGALMTAPGTKWTLLAVFLFTICAQFEKHGISISTPSIFTAVECFIAAILLYLFKPKGERLANLDLALHRTYLLPIGFLFGMMMLAQSYAFSTGNISYTVAIKRLSTVATVLYGCLFLGEAALGQRLLGCLIMVSGAILISLSL
jgi:uncharacterized membrane protein